MSKQNYRSPTQETFNGLQAAFDHFNAELFDNRLPPVHMSVERKRGAHGYFWQDQYQHREDGDTLHMIALNPDTMSRDLKEVLSTLVHEMVHLQQQEEGKPSKTGHNKEWGTMMKAVGLYPSATAAPGGKETGRRVSHYIVEGGPYELAFETLNVELPYFTNPRGTGTKAKKKDLSKLKFCCPVCSAAAWGKQGLMLICGECDETLIQEEIE